MTKTSTPKISMNSKADLHIHTRFSYDSLATIRSVVNNAIKQGLKIIAITDHDSIKGALKVQNYVTKKSLPLEVIVGEEITTLSGHVIGLFLKKHIPPFQSLRETIKQIKSQGGLVVIPHPSFKATPSKPNIFRIRVHYQEIINDPWTLENIDAIEAANFTMFADKFGKFVNKEFVNNQKDDFNKALLASSDAHHPKHIARCFTQFPGETIKDLKKAIQSRSTKPVATKPFTKIDWIFHYLWASKTPFTWIFYAAHNHLQRLKAPRS